MTKTANHMQKARSMYNEMLHWGQIPQLLTTFENDFFARNVNPLETITDTELLTLAYDSKTASRREHAFEAYTPENNWKIGDTVELARVTIPHGYLGVLTRIDTLVIDSTTGDAISTWANPDSWDNVFRFVVSYNHESDQNVNNRWIYIPATALASTDWIKTIQSEPLFPILSWDDDRYAWGNPSNDIGVVLPKQIHLRLFAVCVENTGFKHRIKGRLVTTTQLEKSISAAWRARRGDRIG